MKIFKQIRNRLMPLKKFNVEILLHTEAGNKYFGKVTVSTTARSAREARNNVKVDDVRLHVGKARAIKGA